jgi:hypothetical protein
MKKIYLLFFVVAFVLSGCSKIPDKVVFEKLTMEELAIAIKNDILFADFYENIRKKVDDMSDIKKATYNDITYRRLFKYIKYMRDTTYWKPLEKKWENEWKNENDIYSLKADSVLNYWKNYLDENSLDKYVKIELAKIDKEYYDYIGEIKEVNLGFRLTPLRGAIEQIRFNYGYKPKINSDSKYYEKHNCISTSPFSSPIVRYWEVSYSDRNNFAGKNVETFLRDYNLSIEVTHIRKDGVNISKDDFNIPESVSDYFEYSEDADSFIMRDYYKDKVIKALINTNYIGKWEYSSKKIDELKEKKDKLCFDFLEEL